MSSTLVEMPDTWDIDSNRLGDHVSRVTWMMNDLMPGPNNPVYANRG